MKKFLILYRSTASVAEQMARATPEETKAGMEAWMAWAKRAGSAIVDLGNPVGQPVMVGAASAQEVTSHVGGFSILQAASTKEVTDLLSGHPHLMAPGGAIEVHEFLPMPGM